MTLLSAETLSQFGAQAPRDADAKLTFAIICRVANYKSRPIEDSSSASSSTSSDHSLRRYEHHSMRLPSHCYSHSILMSRASRAHRVCEALYIISPTVK